MSILVALFVACGGAFIGASLGLALYAALFEILRPMDLDAAIDSPDVRDVARYAVAGLGFAIGLWLARRWHPSSSPADWRIVVIAALAGAGGAMLGHYADLGGLFIQLFGFGKDAYILMMLGGALVFWLAGTALAVLLYGGAADAVLRRALFACGGTFALLWVGLAVDKAARAPFDRSSNRSTWFEVRFPAAVTAPLAKDRIRVHLRTDQGQEPGFVTEWLREDERLLLRGSVDLNLRTRQRTLVLSVPDHGDVTFEMRMPANPRPSFGYGTWHRTDGTVEPAPAAADDFAIRYMIM
jgi:hypothetical protein